MKDQIIAAIAEYLKEETCIRGIDINDHASKIFAKIEPILSTPTNLEISKPTRFEKNSLPNDIKLLFHKGVELYQCIQNYELGVFTKEEFIKEMRKNSEIPKESTPLIL